MTPIQLHFLEPGDRVRRRGKVSNQIVRGIVVYFELDTQTVDAVKIRDTMYQREELLREWDIVP